MLPVITYPNPLLKKRSLPVEHFDESLHRFLDEMYETMLGKNGVGLAAVQVGKLIRVLIINLPNEEGEQKKEDLLEVINPEFLTKEGEILFSEGCLSVPEFYEEVARSEYVRLSYQDRFGNRHELEAHGYLAVALQHETDHLNGVLFIDKLPLLKRKKFEKELKLKKRRQSPPKT